jgi:uncharacterized protein YndB with AHSA1/START domain
VLVRNKIIRAMQTNHKSTYRTVIHAPVEKVWDALTKPELVKQYFFGSTQQTDWKPGSSIIWTGDYEGKSYTDKGVVQEFTPYKKIAYSYLSSWSDMEDKPENYLLVTYDLNEVSDGTELTITQSNYDEEKAKHSAANWAAVIDGLKKLVE